jgi:hypothetical protein
MFVHDELGFENLIDSPEFAFRGAIADGIDNDDNGQRTSRTNTMATLWRNR